MEPNRTYPKIGDLLFVDGVRRTVYLDGDRQFVLDDDGERVYGVWLVEEDADQPICISADR